MGERVYVETTVVSYLTAWPSRDVVMAGHQQVTHEWWNTQREHYELCISQLVLTVLEATDAALELAKGLLQVGALPRKAAGDALHIAVAAAHGVPYLLTWNCRHLANATMRPLIESACTTRGFRAPIICTPEELLESSHE